MKCHGELHRQPGIFVPAASPTKTSWRNAPPAAALFQTLFTSAQWFSARTMRPQSCEDSATIRSGTVGSVFRQRQLQPKLQIVKRKTNPAKRRKRNREALNDPPTPSPFPDIRSLISTPVATSTCAPSRVVPGLPPLPLGPITKGLHICAENFANWHPQRRL